jgi:hypothetical protein
MLLQILEGLAGLASLVCFILVLVRMFQVGQTGLGIVCIVLVFCVGIGGLVAFIVGWINANQWGIRNIMMAWTACFIVGVALTAIGFAIGQNLAVPLGR